MYKQNIRICEDKSEPSDKSVLWLSTLNNKPILKVYSSNGWELVNDSSGNIEKITQTIQELTSRVKALEDATNQINP